MFRVAFVVLATMACAQARPRLTPESSGQSSSGITKSETVNPLGGTSTTVHQQSGTSGEANHGGFNVGTASSDTQSQSGLLGTSSSSNTDAKSVQGSIPAFSVGGGLQVQPIVPVFPNGFGFGSATGQSVGDIIKGETIGPHGVKSFNVHQQSVTGGKARQGGFNVGTASSDTQSLNTPHGISSSSNTDAQSVQGSNPAFPSFGDGLVYPNCPPGIPGGVGFDSATGQSVGNIIKGETIDPFGVKSSNVHQQSITGGEARQGGFNVGTASSDTQSMNTPHGISSSSNTDAQSVQGSMPGLPPIGGGLGYSNCPGISGGVGFGSATGQSSSAITENKIVNALGGKSNVVQIQSGTGGKVKQGGFNFGAASSDTQSLNTPHGISSSSNTDAKSVQGSNPLFPSFGGAVAFPRFPSIPGLNVGSATGQADSRLTQSDTIGLDGSQNKVTVLGSSAGGSAQDGGASVNKASGSTSSTDGISGSHTQSHVDSQSIQTSGR